MRLDKKPTLKKTLTAINFNLFEKCVLVKIMKHIRKIKPKISTKNSISKFLQNLFDSTSKGLTKNHAITFSRSGSRLLDFFAQAGAMRGKPDVALELFQKAFAEDEERAIRILFYLRDIRGGQGERELFRNCLEWLGNTFPKVFEQVIKYVPEYGRWDDLFFDNETCFEFIRNQLKKDNTIDTPSLLAKWLPTINASSITTQAKAKFMADKLQMSSIEYRKTVRKLRAKLQVVEEKMSANKWSEVEYEKVPSQASRIYKNAFKKHDEERYGVFINKATTCEVKINASTLYPYQIYNSVKKDYSPTLEALWNQLPDYTQGKNALVVADVSGSMRGDPMAVSVSLALYFAERNKGQFKDYFITFSGNPKLQKIAGKTLQDKMNSLERAEWEMNTNLQAVFNLILNSAKGCLKEEMPGIIYIISDMEFDNCCSTHTNFEHIKGKYEHAGYTLPNLVFWNVNGSGSNLPVKNNEYGVSLVSGFSPTIFKIAVENKTPEEVMFEVINDERYLKVKIN